MAKNPTCAGIRRDGSPCGSVVVNTGSGYCAYHARQETAAITGTTPTTPTVYTDEPPESSVLSDDDRATIQQALDQDLRHLPPSVAAVIREAIDATKTYAMACRKCGTYQQVAFPDIRARLDAAEFVVSKAKQAPETPNVAALHQEALEDLTDEELDALLTAAGG